MSFTPAQKWAAVISAACLTAAALPACGNSENIFPTGGAGGEASTSTTTTTTTTSTGTGGQGGNGGTGGGPVTPPLKPAPGGARRLIGRQYIGFDPHAPRQRGRGRRDAARRSAAQRARGHRRHRSRHGGLLGRGVRSLRARRRRGRGRRSGHDRQDRPLPAQRLHRLSLPP
ncbi:MAG: hypothetical protein QM820_64410 [Minicystis sp.]